ncbi:hypothetical protein [Vulcanisaeta distributa]|uniref:Uncharacterized protein n=1 Tax=Vulcanisaeta distributa (strain DSM 14429 / JCM 11212 / NBRC 100878 / IC-017) TaxID=572478 RepID=E1QN98_VULDI|nr:hypothetical protein [Vulcanisaeta distributa]ADN50068.1 hypothetical protein Vdis_0673 [Vulcanisaeta distributa DSM 14429]
MNVRSVLSMVTVVVAVVIVLFVVMYLLTPRYPPPGITIVPSIDYGFLPCNDHFVIIPGDSMVAPIITFMVMLQLMVCDLHGFSSEYSQRGSNGVIEAIKPQ